jgi:hypothetical protein
LQFPNESWLKMRRDDVVDFMVIHGTGLGAIVGGLIGILSGLAAGFYAVQMGAAAGGLSGLLIGITSARYFSPITNKRSYRMVTALIAFIVSGIVVFVLWWNYFPDFKDNFMRRSLMAGIAAVLGASGSQLLVQRFLTKKKKKR